MQTQQIPRAGLGLLVDHWKLVGVALPSRISLEALCVAENVREDLGVTSDWGVSLSYPV